MIPTVDTALWSLTLQDVEFTPDELGKHFEHTQIELGEDPDGETPIRFTLTRYVPDGPLTGRPAIFLVHGMTDYFFQVHVAEYLHQQGFAVYGLDLRKCGRSWREGQTWHHVTSQALYDTELSLTLNLLSQEHPQVFAIGHSTGGLNVTTWAMRLSQQNPALHHKLSGLVLNSPWFGLQFDAATKALINHVLPRIAQKFPHLRLPGGFNPAYGESIHASKHGEWAYNLELKPLQPRPKYVSWLVGIKQEIDKLQSSQHSTAVPTLLLCSDNADLILNPAQMRENAHNAHPHTKVATIPGAFHDVFLSPQPVRDAALATTAEWLQEHS